MLTRWQSERVRPGVHHAMAVALMLAHSGSQVCHSGLVLMVAWFALCFFPVAGVDNYGLCSAITVALCVAINVLVIPCILMLGERFFE